MRPLLPLLIAVVLVGTAVGCTPSGRHVADDTIGSPPIPETIRYTALGDSLGTGAGADTSYVASYASWLGTETGSQVEVTNLAVDGWTSQDLLDALTEDEQLRAAAADAHVLTWTIGGNDLLAALSSFLQDTCGGADGQTCLRDAVTMAAANIDAVLVELLELRDGESRGIRTLDLYLPFMEDPGVGPHLDELRPYLDRLNDHVAQITDEHGVAVAEVEAAFHGPAGDADPVARGLISEDGLHPSNRGHEVIAQELAALGLELGHPERAASTRASAWSPSTISGLVAPE
jgi:lysophospholipase L1-like esterase